MPKFSIKIISYGVASSTKPNEDESMSFSSSLGTFSSESICDYNILIVRLENVSSYNDVMQIHKAELDEFFGKPSIIVCFSDRENLYKESSWLPAGTQPWISPPKTARNYDWLPNGEDLGIVSKRGRSIESTSNAGKLSNLFNTYKWEYKCSFDKIPSNYIPIACNISGQFVGLRADVGEGRIFIIPTPDINITDVVTYPTFLRILTDICREEIQELAKRERAEPDWVQSQVDSLESKLFNDMIPIYERYQTLRETRKLLYETGTRLTTIVLFVLNKMGFNAKLREDEGIQDIEICEDDFNFVIEVTSSEEDWINIRKTRQLLDWCQRFKREQNKRPKGVLIANHFCNYPSKERDEPFTKEALKQGKSEGFCLMTTEQLYKIFCKFFKDEMSMDEIKKLFSETTGLLKIEG